MNPILLRLTLWQRLLIRLGLRKRSDYIAPMEPHYADIEPTQYERGKYIYFYSSGGEVSRVNAPIVKGAERELGRK